MTNRFYIPQLNASQQKIILKDSDILHQIKNVLRLKPGDKLAVFSQTHDIELAILDINDNFIAAKKIKSSKKNTQPKATVNLYQSLLKKDKFEWVIQKATELGVSKIVPIITEHSIVREISDNKARRYEKIAIEATEQCGGEKPPEILPALSFDDVLKQIKKATGNKIMLWEGEKNRHISSLVGEKNKEWHVIIGPEGGFSPAEKDKADHHGIILVSLGQRILRAETAAIASLSLILLNEN